VTLGGDPPSGPACPYSGTLPPVHHVFCPVTTLPQTCRALMVAYEMGVNLRSAIAAFSFRPYPREYDAHGVGIVATTCSVAFGTYPNDLPMYVAAYAVSEATALEEAARRIGLVVVTEHLSSLSPRCPVHEGPVSLFSPALSHLMREDWEGRRGTFPV